MLNDLPDTPEHARDELGLRRLYAVVLSQTEGYAADAMLENLTRTQTLSEHLGDDAARFDALSALAMLYGSGGDRARTAEIVGQLSQLAERLGAAAALEYHFLRGATALWSGDLNVAESFLARALSSPTELEDAARPYGVNPVVSARSLEGLRRWMVGDPARARAIQHEALVLAEQHGRPFTLAHAATFSAILRLLDEDWAEAAKLATRAIDLSDEYGFPRWWGTAHAIRGRALAEEGDGDQALAEIRGGLAALERAGLRFGSSLMLSLLAGACLRLDRGDEGLAATDAGLTHCRETGERLFEAELWRLRGELLVQRARVTGPARAAPTPEVEECFEKARAVAREQGAHMFERRASRGSVGAAAVRRASR